MTRSRPIVLLGALALIWGSSFMFIKVADREVEPSTLILGRLWLATLTLAVVVPLLTDVRSVAADLRAHWPPLLVIGLLNTAVPFWLLSFGMYGLVGLVASVVAWLAPAGRAIGRLGNRRWLGPTGGASASLVALLVIHFLDGLTNSVLILPLLAAAGGLNQPAGARRDRAWSQAQGWGTPTRPATQLRSHPRS